MPADPTPPPVPALPLGELMKLASPLLREAFDCMPIEQAAITALGRRIRAEVARIHAAGVAAGRTAAAADPEPSHAKCGCPVTVERVRMTTHTSACRRMQNTAAAADRLNSMIAEGKPDDRS